MSKLKVGQVWKTREGLEVTITQFDGIPPYPFLADNHESYTESGTLYENYPSGDDLVELIKEAPELELAPPPAANNPEDGGPAFPVQDSAAWQGHGMTLRDYFAAKAMMAYLTHEQGATAPESMIAGAAYKYADAMLEARNK